MHRLQGQSLVQVGVAIQDSYVVPVDRVMAAPGMLCQCRVCTVTRLHCPAVLPQSLVELPSCLSYVSGWTNRNQVPCANCPATILRTVTAQIISIGLRIWVSPVYRAPYAVMKLRFFRNHKHTQQLSPIYQQCVCTYVQCVSVYL